MVYCSIVTDAVKIPMEVNNDGTCSSKTNLNAIRLNVEQVLNTIMVPDSKGFYGHLPANSCADIYSGHPSGYYWLNKLNRSTAL